MGRASGGGRLATDSARRWTGRAPTAWPASSSCSGAFRSAAGRWPTPRAARSARWTTPSCGSRCRRPQGTGRRASHRPDAGRSGNRSRRSVRRRALIDPWREAPKVQPPTTRLIDLALTEEDLWSIPGAQAPAVRVQGRAEGGHRRASLTRGGSGATAPALADFDRIYRYTGQRAGFAVRSRPTTSGCGPRSPVPVGLSCSSPSEMGSGWPPCSTSSAATAWPRSMAG